jgi:beta-ribofuranosylaminobenzene 5'-phosphate synthase
VGLGSKTALVLGVLKASDLALGLNLGRDVLQKLSGRGGTSGIGVNAFFSGGYLADCGHPISKTSRFAPSSRRSEFVVPPVSCRLGIPTDWRFHLILLPGRRLTSRTEMKFFRQNTPIPDAEVLSSMAAVYHGVIPAVLSGDIDLLKEALRDVRSTGFKARELRNQADPVKDFIKDADDRTGLALGMSSLGPLIFAIGTEKDEKDGSIVKELILRYRGVMLGVFRGRNHGYEADR